MTPEERLYTALCTQSKALGRRLTKDEYLAVFRDQIALIRKESTKERKRGGVHPDAERIYNLFPKKVGRDDALSAISKALEKNTVEYLLDKTSQFARCVADWPSSYRYFTDGGDRCPHPASWFNAGRYADEVSEWKRAGARVSPPKIKIDLPEPDNWRDAYPDYIHVNKLWHDIDTASQRFICDAMQQRAHA